MGNLFKLLFSFFSKSSGGLVNTLKNFGSKTIQGIKNFKLNKSTKPKPFNSKARRFRLRNWLRLLKNMFKTKEKQVFESIKVETKEEKQDEDVTHDKFIPNEFEYKPTRYSKHDILNNIINNYNKELKHRTHRINEIERRIEFIFTELANKEKQNVFSQNIKAPDTEVPIHEPEPEPNNFNFFRFLRFGKLRFRRKLRKWKRRVKARIRKARMERERKRREREAKRKAQEAEKARRQGNKNYSYDDNDKSQTNKKKTLNANSPDIDPKTGKPKKIEKNLNDPAFDSFKEGMKPVKEAEEKHIKIAEEKEKAHNAKMKAYDDEIKGYNKIIDNPKSSWWDVKKAQANKVIAYTKMFGKSVGNAVSTLWDKGKYFLDLANTFKNSLIDMAKNAITKTKEAFPKMFRLAALGGKAMAKFVKAIPLIGSILSAIIAIFEIGNARNALEVRKALFSSIGASLGGFIGFALGSWLPFIGNIIFGFIGGMLGDFIGDKLANVLTRDVIDFLPFDLYKSPLADRMVAIGPEFEAINKSERGAFNRLIPQVQEATKTGQGLQPDDNVLTQMKKVCQETLNTAGFPPEIQLAGEGGLDQYGQFANPEQLDGARVVVERYKVATDWRNRGFTHGRLQLIGGDGKVIYQAVTTERPVEGTARNQNLRMPAGTYDLTLVQGPKHGITLRLSNQLVPLDRAVLIHKGNTVDWTEGCVVISQGNTFGGLIGQTGTKETAIKTHNEFYAAVWQLLGLNQSNVNANLWKKTKLPLQIFNKFGSSSADSTGAKNAKGSEPIVSNPTHTINRTTENNTTIQVKQK